MQCVFYCIYCVSYNHRRILKGVQGSKVQNIGVGEWGIGEGVGGQGGQTFRWL